MASVRLPEELEARLNDLAERTRRSKGFYMKEALQLYLDDLEDAHVALERILDPKAKFMTSKELLDEVERDKKV